MKRGNIEFIAAMLIFGFNGVLAAHIPWHSYEVVFARTVVGALSMFLTLLIQKKKLMFRENIKSFKILIISGIIVGLSWMMLYEAYRQLGVGFAQILSSSGPALAIIAAPVIFKEELKKHKILGLFIVLVGMFLLCSNDLSGGISFGLLCGIGTCLFYAGFVICNHFDIPIKGAERTMWQLIIAAIVVFIFIIYKGTGIPTDFSIKTIILVLILGTINTGVAMNLMFSSIPKLPIQTVGIYAYIEPMSALMFSALFLGERVGVLQLIGTAMIIGGTAFSELYKSS